MAQRFDPAWSGRPQDMWPAAYGAAYGSGDLRGAVMERAPTAGLFAAGDPLNPPPQRTPRS